MTLYARRNTAALGEYYVRHIEAVTDENLCEASDIAAELAWRDREIDRLRSMIYEIPIPATVPASILTADTNADDDVRAESVRINSAAHAPTMTKRELIAAMALQGLLAAEGDVSANVTAAVQFADALLEELAK